MKAPQERHAGQGGGVVGSGVAEGGVVGFARFQGGLVRAATALEATSAFAFARPYIDAMWFMTRNSDFFSCASFAGPVSVGSSGHCL